MSARLRLQPLRQPLTRELNAAVAYILRQPQPALWTLKIRQLRLRPFRHAFRLTARRQHQQRDRPGAPLFIPLRNNKRLIDIRVPLQQIFNRFRLHRLAAAKENVVQPPQHLQLAILPAAAIAGMKPALRIGQRPEPAIPPVALS